MGSVASVGSWLASGLWGGGSRKMDVSFLGAGLALFVSCNRLPQDKPVPCMSSVPQKPGNTSINAALVVCVLPRSLTGYCRLDRAYNAAPVPTHLLSAASSSSVLLCSSSAYGYLSSTRSPTSPTADVFPTLSCSRECSDSCIPSITLLCLP